MKPLLSWLSLFTVLLATGPQTLRAQSPRVPKSKVTQTLVASADFPETPYLAFPALLDLGSDVLVSFKRGRSHAADPGAVLDLLRLDPETGKAKALQTLAQMDSKIMQMGEWVRFANGDIANFIDAQQKEVPTRIGLQVVRSTDGGQSFGPVQQVGIIDGVEYGYAFEAITRQQTTWMLVMTFGNLPGGKIVHQTRSQPGSVDVIRTDDSGKTWRFVRSITQELGGAAINESSFMTHGEGFIVAARGYGPSQWLLMMDADFQLQHQVDIAASHAFIHSHIGRPRIFTRDGGCYLLARNFMEPSSSEAGDPKRKTNPMQLALFKFDPKTFNITQHVLLDNAESANVTDGYYAMPYWREREGHTYLNIVTYKRLADQSPDILRLEFDWEEVK